MDELEIVKQPEEIASVEAIVVENEEYEGKTKYCKHCGKKIPEDAVVCVKCGRQVEELKKSAETPNIVINNSNTNEPTNTNTNTNNVAYAPNGRMRKKWVAMLLLIFLGMLGGHKFYNGKYIVGIIYILLTITWMLSWVVVIACIIDFFILLFKPSVYYV